ncbi:MAG TPA: gluconokinase [Polyangia bacterium]|nr:gluconokinase [Polyangia bacterium]
MIIVVMGVSGVGKTTVAAALARRLGWAFVEADELHPRANVEKMARGEALDDEDRAPWLEAVARRMAGMEDGVVACSALKAKYREVLGREGKDVRFVLLDAPLAVIRERIEGRKGHFMPAALLDSQVATLERTAELVVVDATRGVDEVVDEIVRRLGLRG